MVGPRAPYWPRAALLLLAAGGLLAGCATGGAHEPTVRPEAGARVAMVPLSLAMGEVPDLHEAEAIVGNEIIRFLNERGDRVGVVHRKDAERTWQAALAATEAAADSAERLDRAAGLFTLTLRDHGDFAFDYVLLPALVYRDARVRGRVARWDGVERRVRSRRASGASQGHYFREWEGEITGLSLHVRVYEPDGRRVYKGWGGLDLTHDPIAVGAAMAPRPMPQEDVLQDPDHVREGVERALLPYLDDAER